MRALHCYAGVWAHWAFSSWELCPSLVHWGPWLMVLWGSLELDDVIAKDSGNNGKFGLSRNQTKYISFESLMRVIQNVTFVEFEPLCQKLWAFMSSFTMTTHKIWSCHVTLVANLKSLYFSPRSVLNFGRSYRIWGKLALAWLLGPFGGGFFVGALSARLSVFGP